MVGAAARVLCAIAGRTGAQRFNGAGQPRGDPVPDRSASDRSAMRPGARWRNQPFHLRPCRGSIGHCATML
jgi:hypothetical protein